MSLFIRVLILVLVATGFVVAPARAADLTMPLTDVQSGMQCTGYSVVRGVGIDSFNVEIRDIIAGEAGGSPSDLVRASGPAVAATGFGSRIFGLSYLLPRWRRVDAQHWSICLWNRCL